MKWVGFFIRLVLTVAAVVMVMCFITCAMAIVAATRWLLDRR